MFIWGSSSKAIDLGRDQSMRCPVCDKVRAFKLLLTYKHSHIYYVFGSVSEKAYQRVCEVCHRGENLDAKAVERELPKNPIPFMHRYGGVIFALIFIGVLSAALFDKK